MTVHLTTDQIDRLILGLATDAELDGWLAHLEQCSDCLERVDQTWPTATTSKDDLLPSLDPRRTREVHRQVLRRIHAYEVLKESLRFIVTAPLAFLQGMLGSRRR